MPEIKQLFTLTGGGKRFIWLTLLRCPFDAAYTFLQAWFLHNAFDAIKNSDSPALSSTCLWFFVGSMLLFLYNGTVWRVYAVAVTKWVGILRKKLFDHISGLSLYQLELKTKGEWITRLNSDAHAATAILNQALHIPHGAVATVSILVTSILLIIASPKLLGLILVFVLPHALINHWLVARPMTDWAAAAQNTQAENTADLDALITCADTAFLYDAKDYLLERFEKSSQKTRSAFMRMRRRSALASGLLPLMGMGGYLALILAGGYMIANGTITFGALTAVFQYRGGLMAGVMMVMSCTVNIKSALAGVNRIMETMMIPGEDEAIGRAADEDWRNRRIFQRIAKGDPHL